MEDNYELYHYGVLGMKWGKRKIQEHGGTYKYKSYGQQRTKKKLERQIKEGASKKSISRTKNNLKMLETRDAKRERYADQTTLGKSVAKQLLYGPFGAGNYNRLRSAGWDRIGAAFVSNWIVSAYAYPITALYSKHAENHMARQDASRKKR